jgi:Septum formation
MADRVEPETKEQGPPPALPPVPALTGGRWRSVLVLVVLIGFLVVVLFTFKDNTTPIDLKVGDCFDIPTATSVQAVTHHACTEPHTAEVFLVTEYSGSPMDTPLALLLDAFVTANCDPAFATYVGKPLADAPELSIGSIYPNPDAWQRGQRTITCYVAKTDQTSMSASLKGSGAQ